MFILRNRARIGMNVWGGLFMSKAVEPHIDNTRTADVMHFIDSHSKYTTRSLRSAGEMPTCTCR
jgi:hypothetical protein